MAIEDQEGGKIEEILKQTLEECVALARKKIRSKRGLADLQNILTDYHQNVELASIILEVVKLIASYENSKREEEQIKQTVSLEDYAALESVLQKCQASNREQIRTQQQLKIYCEQLQAKKQDLQLNNKQLLNSTKQIITNLKRQHQRLIEENATLKARIKDIDGKEDGNHGNQQRQQNIMNSIKKARKMIDNHNNSSHREESSRLGSRTDRSESNLRLPKSSLSSIKIAK